MTRQLFERVKQLENTAKIQNDAGLFIDMKNTQVRVDIGGKRGQVRNFDSVEAAGRWLEKVIDEHPAATGSIIVDDFCSLYSDPEDLRAEIAGILGNRVIGSPMGDMSSGGIPVLHFGTLKTMGTADINLWLLADAIWTYYRTAEFSARLKINSFTEQDRLALQVFLTFFVWDRIDPYEKIANDFLNFFYQVGGRHE